METEREDRWSIDRGGFLLLDGGGFMRHSEKRLRAVAREGSANMTTAKERIVEIVGQLPDDSSYEEILRELAFVRMIDRGLADSREARTITNEDMERQIRTW